MPSKILLLALAFAVTLGGVASPLGSPQNLLIALNGGMENPFTTFLNHLLLPTILNLFFAYLLLRLAFKKHFRRDTLTHSQKPVKDRSLAALSKASLFVILALIAGKTLLALAGSIYSISLTWIALAAAAPVLAFSPKRLGIIRRIDWHTLVFFAAMFVLMQSVWDSGVFQGRISSMGFNILSTPAILAVSILASQFISNVPLVALYMPLLVQHGAGIKELMALAAGSTIAGNLLILGAASNVIIIQSAEKKAGETVTLWEFAKIGIPLTLINLVTYWVFLG